MKDLFKVLLFVLVFFSNAVSAWQVNKVKDPVDIRGSCATGNAISYSYITMADCIARIISVWGQYRYEYTGEPYLRNLSRPSSWRVDFYYNSGLNTWGRFDYDSPTTYTSEHI